MTVLDMLLVSDSGLVVLMDAELLMLGVQLAWTVAWMVMVAIAPGIIVPKLTVTVLPMTMQPAPIGQPVTITPVRQAGNMSVTITLLATAVPALLAVSV